jgi:hypothetical protein
MSDDIDLDRRSFVGTAALGFAGAQFGMLGSVTGPIVIRSRTSAGASARELGAKSTPSAAIPTSWSRNISAPGPHPMSNTRFGWNTSLITCGWRPSILRLVSMV